MMDVLVLVWNSCDRWNGESFIVCVMLVSVSGVV